MAAAVAQAWVAGLYNTLTPGSLERLAFRAVEAADQLAAALARDVGVPGAVIDALTEQAIADLDDESIALPERERREFRRILRKLDAIHAARCRRENEQIRREAEQREAEVAAVIAEVDAQQGRKRGVA